jgi:hypothetical protein
MSIMPKLVTLANSTERCSVISTSNKVATKLWFKTGPLNRDFCYRAIQLQLWTDSHDQGRAGDPKAGSWSWFEIVLFADESATDPIVRDGKEMVWKSHFNRLDSGSDFARHYGIIFDRRQEIFDALQVSASSAMPEIRL